MMQASMKKAFKGAASLKRKSEEISDGSADAGSDNDLAAIIASCMMAGGLSSNILPRDPVSKQGLGIEKLKCALIQAGIKRVDVRLYEEARHEILNETNRADVFKDLLYWLAGLKSEL